MSFEEEKKEVPPSSAGLKRRRPDSDAVEPEMHHVLPETLTSSFRSKKDLYDWFSLHLQLVLPPLKEC
jgi:hypothetical protein